MFQDSLRDGYYCVRMNATHRAVYALVADTGQRPPVYTAVKRIEYPVRGSWDLHPDGLETIWKTTDRAEATRKRKALVSGLSGVVRTTGYPETLVQE